MQKIESHLTLDLNLEKSRIREEFTSLDQRIKDTNNKIGTEVCVCVCEWVGVGCMCVDMLTFCTSILPCPHVGCWS